MSMKTASLLIIDDNCTSEQFQSTNVIEYFKGELNELDYKIEKISILRGIENVINYEIDFMLKHYDVAIITGGFSSGVLLKSVKRFLTQHNLPCNGIADLPQSSNGLRTISKFNDISIPLSVITKSDTGYPLIHFQRIFIIASEDYKQIFTILLKPYLIQYRKDPWYRKLYQIVVNGNSNFNYIDELDNEYVKVKYKIIDHILKIEVESTIFDRLTQVDEELHRYLTPERINNQEYYVPWSDVYLCQDVYVQNALKDIEKCFKQYGPDNIFLSFNGGKDCTVLLHLMCVALKKYSDYKKPLLCMYVQSESPFDEQNQFIKQCELYYNLKVITFQTSIKVALEQILSTYPNLKACLMGTRRTDPFSKNLAVFSMTDSDWPQVMRVSPLLDWHYSDIWDYILYFKVPFCTLYEMGYTSLGSKNDTLRNSSLIYYNVTEDKEMYLPAHKLLKESKERNGRSGNRL